MPTEAELKLQAKYEAMRKAKACCALPDVQCILAGHCCSALLSTAPILHIQTRSIICHGSCQLI